MAKATVRLSVRRRWWVNPYLMALGLAGAASFLFHRDEARAEKWMSDKAEFVGRYGLIVKSELAK